MLYFYTVRWQFVSDEENWISSFVIEVNAGGPPILDCGRAALNNLINNQYLGEEIAIVKEHFEPVEVGIVRSWQPKR